MTISDFGDHEFDVTSRDVTVVAGESANASFVAEAEAASAFIYITDVTDGSPENTTYSGLVTATVEIERGAARFEKITLYVDSKEKEVDSQSFGLPSAPAEDAELAAAQQVPFTLSFDSGDYEETGAVTHSNGAHKIFVGLTVKGSTEQAYSNQVDVEFDNEDGVLVAVSDRTRGAHARPGRGLLVWWPGCWVQNYGNSSALLRASRHVGDVAGGILRRER